jgi:hypothetical protein
MLSMASMPPRRASASRRSLAVWTEANAIRLRVGSAAVWTVAATACVLWLAAPTAAHAQRRFAIAAEVGSGLEVAGGGGQALLRRTPVYLEVGVLSWLAHDDGVWLGGGLRVEVEERASVGGALRAGLFLRAAPVEVRPSLGVVAIVAPFTLIGPELGVTIAISLADAVALAARVVLDGFLAGSDLVQGSVLVMANASLGIEIHL